MPGKVFSAHQDGAVCIWDSTGVKDETVFGDFDEQFVSENNSQSDSSDVTIAVRILEKYLRKR